MVVRHVGVREFKDQATVMLASGETFVIERRGRPIGFYVPIEATDRVAGKAALARLSATVAEVLEAAALDEDELVDEVIDGTVYGQGS